MVKRLFWAHGEFCAAHPWEVIVATLTLTVCMLTVDKQSGSSTTGAGAGAGADRHCGWRKNCIGVEEYHATDVIIMTLIRCVAVLYTYYQFCNLKKLGSNYILGIAGLFTVFSSFAFSSSVINFMRSDISDLKDALFFFLLLIDLSKATLLAQLALSASSQTEVRQNIARGLALLGPTITLDTIVATLVIGVGTLSGIRRLEVLCCFACMSVMVNYVVFMTFYPACLSLILELSGRPGVDHPSWDMKRYISREEDQKANPVVQRVKVIMAAGLMLVHAHSRWMLREGEANQVTPLVVGEHVLNTNRTADGALQDYIMRWLTVSADQIVILILLLALAVKFMLFENQDDIIPRGSSNPTNMSATEGSTTVAPSILHAGVTITSAVNRVPTRDGWVQMSRDLETTEDKEVQTEQSEKKKSAVTVTLGDDDDTSQSIDESEVSTPIPEEELARTFEDCVAIYKSTGDASSLHDEEVLQLVLAGLIPGHMIEKTLMDPERAVGIRRNMISMKAGFSYALDSLPYKNYDYGKVQGACCENVIGYMPVPVGVAGPLVLDSEKLFIPLATTEGCLVASTNRGCSALRVCGVQSHVVADGMTRAPVVQFPSAGHASRAMRWLQDETNFETMKTVFDSTSRFARLLDIQVRIAGRLLYVRFVATTGDAMGMNMLSKGTEVALTVIQREFPEMEVISLSGNYCTDKKPAAVNWVQGRGKTVVCEATVPAKVVNSVLKTTVSALVSVNLKKNLIGSAVAGSIGGFNAHAANLVTALYIATGQDYAYMLDEMRHGDGTIFHMIVLAVKQLAWFGQDPAQNVGSSNCMTLMEAGGPSGEDLYITCTMPSIEVGTIGGGTILPAQSACLEMLGVKGPHSSCPGQNAEKLARIVCATVLAGELSLMSALAANHLVTSHLKHNRSSAAVNALDTTSSASVHSSRLEQPVCPRVQSGL